MTSQNQSDQEQSNQGVVLDDRLRAVVRDHYGKVADGDPEAGCAPGCCGASPDNSLQLGYSADDLSAVPEGANLGLGCGNPHQIASLRPGQVVVDLGSGAGFDCFLASKQVGPTGRVIGIDMTPSMLSKARDNAASHGVTNVEFRLGEIEHLPIGNGSVDVILSNCVINLSPRKEQVFRDAYRVLRAGGRLAISDVVAIAPIPDDIRDRVDALVGCAAGAAPVRDIEHWLREAGFAGVSVIVKPESREFIKDWIPGSGIENYVASAEITATKPGTPCCGAA